MQKAVLEAIRAHVAAEYPREACGVLVRRGRRERYRPCRNLAATPEQEFILAPEDYAAAEDEGVITGIVHSHPNATARASEADQAYCNAGTLPWYILSWPEGDLNVITPRQVPLEGRPFVHGVQDCYALVRDWYRQERGITLPDFPRADGWWERGEDLYLRQYRDAGFEPAHGDPQPGDVLLMQVMSAQVNHAAIFLGDGQMLHHLYGRPSCRTPYGGYWLERTVLRVRYTGDLPA